jgi:hypothetical protein
MPISWLDRCREARSSWSNPFKCGIYPNNIHTICSPPTGKTGSSLHKTTLNAFFGEKIGVYPEKHRNP